jgi:hypothetical protein
VNGLPKDLNDLIEPGSGMKPRGAVWSLLLEGLTVSREFEGRTALVTGGGRNIGGAIHLPFDNIP